MNEWENSCDVASDAGAEDLCRTRGGQSNSTSAPLTCDRYHYTNRNSQYFGVGIRCCADAL